MLTNLPKKTKINLEDYDFEKDINNRLLMATFSVRDIEILEEILNSSVIVNLDTLADNLDTTPDLIAPSLEKLKETGLFKIEDQSLVCDKEMRKYYEFQILKFDEDFQPNMEFLQGLLKKVPIHALPNWYLLPRTSDNIFLAIVDKFLLTPQIYRRYLSEVSFNEEALAEVIQYVFEAPSMTIESKDLMEKLQMPREEFERMMLTLEFSFVCCLSYRKSEDSWQEVVTPFYEWSQYQNALETLAPSPIENTQELGNLKLYQPTPFCFINDMAKILSLLSQQNPFKLENLEGSHSLSQKQALNLKFETYLPQEEWAIYSSRLIKKICQTKMAEVIDQELHLLNWGEEWLQMSQEDQAFNLYRHPLNKLLDSSFDEKNYPPRCAREVEKNLEILSHNKWVYLDDFLKALTGEIGHSGHVKLEKKGRHWHYTLPKYQEQDFAYVRTILTQKLRRLGVIEMGTINDKACIRLTDFAHRALTFHH